MIPAHFLSFANRRCRGSASKATSAARFVHCPTVPSSANTSAPAGCSLNPEGRSRLEEYLAMAAEHPAGALAFSLDGTVGEWTKRAALAAFAADTPQRRGHSMVLAGILVLRAGPATLDLVREWERRMADLRIVDDSPSPEGDLLVYCDAGCSLNAEGRSRLEEYLALAAADPAGVLAFSLDGTVGEWTKRAALAALGGGTPGGRPRPPGGAGRRG
ncbi:MAG: hypothetical protein ACKOHK_12710, partial [Planctomycetia bacterium]